MIPHYPLLVNGEFKETKEKQKIINPSNGEVIAEVSVAGEMEIEEAISVARVAFDNGEWPKISLAERKKFILKIAEGILERAA